MSAPTVPSYQDGLTALGQLTATCLNTSTAYICFDGDPSEEGVQKRFANQSGNPLGSDTRCGFTAGTLNMQLAKATDSLPRPSYVFSFNGGYYVAGNIGPKLVSNGEVKFSVAVLKAVNPVITSLLSADGQYKSLALTKSSAMSAFANTVVNAATGAVAWAAATLPDGLSINASTGEITGTPTAAGTTSVVISATGADGKVGYGILEITVT